MSSGPMMVPCGTPRRESSDLILDLCLNGCQQLGLDEEWKPIKIWHIVDYYSPAMLGLKIDQEVLEELVKVKAPAVGQLMAQYPGIWTLVVSRWFICLYIDILPIETVLRVWDCLFYEGSKVLFRVALTLIIHHQPEILRARSLPDVCDCFKQITSGAFTLDCHTFMQKIFSEPGRLSMATIEKLRKKCKQQILDEESGQP